MNHMYFSSKRTPLAKAIILKKPTTLQRLWACLLAFTVFLPSVSPYAQLWANNNGPNAPEAASFEPVDATDMVNLLTGDFTYVLPLMNVPSPEGGYPIALAYHAGIAMDQEASWVGLGWNLNPGAINRTVNGYPDDYKGDVISEYFYDEGRIETHKNLSIGFGVGAISVATHFNWGSHQSLNGTVSINAFGGSLTVDKDGISDIGVGIQVIPGTLSLGVSLNRNGKANFSVNTNSSGLSVGLSTAGNGSLSIGANFKGGMVKPSINISSNSDVGFGLGNGVGSSVNRMNSGNGMFSQGDYDIEQRTKNMFFIVPFVSVSFSKTKVKYFAGSETEQTIFGASQTHSAIDYIREKGVRNMKMDVYELPLTDSNEFSNHYSIENNNPIKLAYDSYSVQAQGLSGSIHPRYLLTHLMQDKLHVNEEHNDYDYQGHSISPNYSTDVHQAKHYFGGQISRFIGLKGVDVYDRHTMEHIRPYDITYNGSRKYTRYKDDYNNRFPTSRSFQGFLITDKDGKTYHYTLPVFNNETITRQSGFSSFHKGESEEKAYRQRTESKYATHWLLTAITGPDYVDNNDHVIGEGDLGYWVSFEYGKWSDAYTWSAHQRKEYIENDYPLPDNMDDKDAQEDYKTRLWTKGHKEMYFLDKIKTRTHTALFIKEEDTSLEGMSPEWEYKQVKHNNQAQTESDYHAGLRFKIPKHNRLKLNRILLLKNEDIVSFDKTSGDNNGIPIEVENGGTPSINNATSPLRCAIFDNVVDTNDNWEYLREKCVKEVILETMSPHTSKSTFFLSNVTFNGKKGASVLPPYSFDYVGLDVPRSQESESENHSNTYGYYKSAPETWSLSKIGLPEGGNIGIEYDNNIFKTATDIIIGNHTDHEAKKDLYNRIVKVIKIQDEVEDFSQGAYRYWTNDLLREDDLDVKFFGDPVSLIQGWKTKPDYMKMNPCLSGSSMEDFNTENLKLIESQFRVFKNINIKSKQDWKAIEPNQQVDVDISIVLGYRIFGDAKVVDDSSSNCRNWIKRFNYSYKGKAVVKPAQDDPSEDAIQANNPDFKSQFSITLQGTPEITPLNYNSNPDDIDDMRFAIEIDPQGVYDQSAGPRVKSIYTSDGQLGVFGSNYYYGKNRSGIGWATYLPAQKGLNIEMPYSTELPSPKPMYRFVEEESVDYKGKILGVKAFEFNVPEIDDSSKGHKLEGLFSIQVTNNGDPSRELSDVNYTLKNNFNSLGQLLSFTTYNDQNKIIAKRSNTYFSPKQIPDSVGVVKQDFSVVKYYRKYFSRGTSIGGRMKNYTMSYSYPSILASTTEDVNGVSFTTTYEDFDDISGVAKRISTYSSKGLALKTEIIPSFRKYENHLFLHMLSPLASKESYFKSSLDTEWKLYDVDVNVWSNSWFHTTPTQTYKWRGKINADGSYDSDTYEAFKYWKYDQVPDYERFWKKTSEITKISPYYQALEVENENDTWTSKKMINNWSKVVATCNSEYDHMYYTGLENPDELQSEEYLKVEKISLGEESSIIKDSDSHTGYYCLSTPPNKTALSFPNAGANLLNPKKVSVWVKSQNEAYKGTKLKVYSTASTTHEISYNPQDIVHAGDWTQLNFYLTSIVYPNGSTRPVRNISFINTSNETVYYDDFRCHPIESTMNSYVYDHWNELWYILGPNNMGAKYEYNAAGELIKTFDEVPENSSNKGGFILSSEHKKSYKNLPE